MKKKNIAKSTKTSARKKDTPEKEPIVQLGAYQKKDDTRRHGNATYWKNKLHNTWE
jgi:hypothetical protein